jgi:N-methylhydantoinase B
VSIDPITLEVVRGRLGMIVDEMQVALIRSAYSNIVKEAGDVSAALFDRSGQLAAQASGVPIHLGAAIPAVARIIEQHFPQDMAAGDVFIMNDPFEGGSHLPDIVAVAPVFVVEKIVGYCCVIAHHVDLGGKTSGSLPVDASDIYQEGLRIPPVKLVHAGKMDPALRRILQANSRFPDDFIGDVEAQISACDVGAAGFRQLVTTYGSSTIEDCIASMQARSEQLTRQQLKSIPPGTYRFTDFMDNDGIDLNTRLKIEIAVIASADHLTFDFTGTCPQVRGPFNATPATVLAAVFYVVRAITGADIDTNSGCFKPMRMILPEGSLVNPTLPAAVNARSMTFCIIIDVLFGALAQALPDLIPAASYEYPNITFGGYDPVQGRYFVFNETACGGLGARPWADGIDVFRSKAGNSLNSPVEVMEMETPLRIVEFGMRADSGGAGKYRGGLGYTKIFEVLRGDITVSFRGDRHFTPPYGLSGGEPGACSVSFVQRADGSREIIPSKRVFRMGPSDRLYVHSAGGGGYGNPQERPLEAIQADIANGKISPAYATSHYEDTAKRPESADAGRGGDRN